MIKLSVKNQAKLEACYEIINDDLNCTNNPDTHKKINSKELRELYIPFIKVIHKVFGQLPEANTFKDALDRLFYSNDDLQPNFNANNNINVKHARQAFKALTKWILELIKDYSHNEKSKILIASYRYKIGSIKDFKNVTFNLK